MTRIRIRLFAFALLIIVSAGTAFAHDVAQGDRGYIATTTGTQFGAFFYLGAKHMADAALDNLGAFERWFGFRPDARVAVLIFGFFHGLGLATKLQDLGLSPEGLLSNLVAFNLRAKQVNCWRSQSSLSR